MKFLMIVAAALLSTAGMAEAYDGDWLYNSYNGEYMELGDNADGSYLALYGTSAYCGSPGASYNTMHRVLDNARDSQISWWVDNKCRDGYVRICVENWQGQWACSTYQSDGWYSSGD